MGERRLTKAAPKPPKVDPEAFLQVIRTEGVSLKKACEKVGANYSLVYSWVRRDKFDLPRRINMAQEAYAKRLAINTAEVFEETLRPSHLVAFLEQFKRGGEQIDSCRYAGFSFKKLQDYCNPAHVDYNWWFAESFEALLEEQRQELRDKAIKGGLADARSAAQLLRDIERVQRPAGKSEDGSEQTISDDQILEALERIAAKVNSEPTELPAVEPGSLQAAPS